MTLHIIVYRLFINKMDEFIKMKGKILTIENPISMFSNLLSNTNELQVKKNCNPNFTCFNIRRDQKSGKHLIL